MTDFTFTLRELELLCSAMQRFEETAIRNAISRAISAAIATSLGNKQRSPEEEANLVRQRITDESDFIVMLRAKLVRMKDRLIADQVAEGDEKDGSEKQIYE